MRTIGSRQTGAHEQAADHRENQDGPASRRWRKSGLAAIASMIGDVRTISMLRAERRRNS